MTIYDIAREANVSVSTVSRVLNGKKNIREETRRKVQAVLDANHYTPSALARGLANSTMKMIGILAVDIRNHHHANIAYTIEQEFTELGYGCVLYNTGMDKREQAGYISMISGRQMDGLVLIGSVYQNAHIQRELERRLSGIPVVMVNGYLPLKNVYGILCDEYAAAYDCVSGFLKKGHRSIGFVQDNNTPSNNRKKSAYFRALKDHGLEEDPAKTVVGVPATLEGGYEATGRLLEQCPDITAILYTEDPGAAGGIRYLHRVGKRIPQDMEVVGFNDSDIARICTPELTSVDNQMAGMGINSARVLHDVLDGREAPTKMMLSANIVYRESSGAP